MAAGTLLPSPVLAQAQAPNLQATINAREPAKARLILKNISDSACQIAATAQGTIAITKVAQAGKTIEPTILDAATDEDLGFLMRQKLKTLQPGESADIPLEVYKLQSGLVLRATAWAADAGVLGTQYAIAADKPLELDLSYGVPITPTEGAPACGLVFASTTAKSNLPSWLIVLVTTVVLIPIIIFIMWWLRRQTKKRKVAAPVKAAAILIALVGAISFAAPASADIVVPPDMRADFDACMNTFNANRDITGPVLDVINNPANHIEIVYTTSGSDMTGYGNTYTIYWNPDDRHAYAGTGGNADPCTSLYHEMYHALDLNNRTFSRDDCAGSGIETKEVMATRAQNALRERLGMPPRSHYGDRALPSGDCAAPANPARCTGTRCGDTNGDPHLRTFDGLRYDFQAVGEFVLARDQSGAFEIQARQTPWEGSRVVSLNTAVAFKVGSGRAEIRSGNNMQLFVNGKSQELKTASLPGDVQLLVEQTVVVFTWKDGTAAYVRPVGAYGLALSVEPSDQLAGKLEGLLGDADGKTENDLHARGSAAIVKPTYNELYPAFADSWRITDGTSLFTYESGKNTNSYTDRSFPDDMGDPKNLPGYAAALTYCKSFGITDEAVLANCALDVALTGRPEFARAASHSQVFAAGANYSGTTWQLNIANPGDSATVTFDAKAGEKIFVDVPHTTLPSQCGGFTLNGPDGKQVADGCLINGSGQIDGKVLPVTGTYAITLAPKGPTGTATVRLIRINDKQGSITPDGPAVTAEIDKPGVIARYTFTGQPGQRVYLDVPNSTLKSQCGVLQLFAPDGLGLSSGCIINGVGDINTVVLPHAGQYTLVVDPAETVTGRAQLRLILATAETKPIAMDGPTLTSTLSKPGSIAQFTFNGTAGQRIWVDVPSSDLPSQCGILVLRAPNGDTLGSGCVINKVGDLAQDGIVLPATGTFTLILDPNDNATGTTAIRLRSR